jgi:hypothetical protein
MGGQPPAANRRLPLFAFEVPTSGTGSFTKINATSSYHDNFIPHGVKSGRVSVIGIQLTGQKTI